VVPLTHLFHVFFEQKEYHGQDQKPGVLGEIANNLPSRFEKKVRDLPD